MNLNELKKLKILFLDIETTPNEFKVLSWNVRDEVTLTHDQLVKERQVIMCSYNWLSEPEDKVHRVTWTKAQDDTRVIKTMAKLIAEADIVLGHNGDNFDIKWLKTRALILDLPPKLNVVSIDTLKLSRANFRLNSNKLDYLSQVLGLGKKKETAYKLWLDVIEGDLEALEEMGTYCDNDVVLLRKVFIKLLPYVQKLPVNIALMTRDNDHVDLVCRHCGVAGKLVKRGFKYTLKTKRQSYQCNNCHHSQS